jgi:hypothetical protein
VLGWLSSVAAASRGDGCTWSRILTRLGIEATVARRPWRRIGRIATSAALAWLALATAAEAERTLVQDVPCAPGAGQRIAADGTVSACRLAVSAELLIDPRGGNTGAACAAGSAVEFHRSGYLSFCEVAAAAAVFRGRDGRETRCRARARLAFSESGYLEYCS